MANILDMYPHWSEVHFFPLYPASGQWKILRNIFGRYKKFSHLFVGDTTHLINLYINKIGKFSEIFFIDDGNSTLSRADKIFEKSLHLERKNHTPRPYWLTIFLLKLGLLQNFAYNSKFFSIYKPNQEIQNKIFIKNNLTYTKSKIKSKSQSNDIWFIGSNLKNEILENPDDYIKLLNEAVQQRPHENIIYIPHRKESDTQLNEFREKLNIKIVRLRNIIEIELLESNEVPKEIISFGSSAIDTIGILTDIKITIFRIPTKYDKNHRKSALERMYRDAQSKEIPIINLRSQEK